MRLLPVVAWMMASLSVSPQAFAINQLFGSVKDCSDQSFQKFIQQIHTYATDNNGAAPALRKIINNSSPTNLWSGVGSLTTGRGNCTAFALKHTRVVVTNAHCFFEAGDDAKAILARTKKNVVFKRGMFQGNVSDQDIIPGRLIYFGSTRHDIEIEKDWAVILLEKDINGEPLQPDDNPNISDADLAAAGYNMDIDRGRSLSAVVGCRGKTTAAGYIENYCSGSGGGSGGPLATTRVKRDHSGKVTTYSEPRAAGIFKGGKFQSADGSTMLNVQPSDESVNLAVPIAKVLPAVNRVIGQIESGIPYADVK